MSETVMCLDTDVLVKFLVSEEPVDLREAATQIVHRAVSGGRLVAPAFAWAEVGSVLRKKVRQQAMSAIRADQEWATYNRLPIEFINGPILRTRAWEIARQYGLPTLYDAAFLACTEVTVAPAGTMREFWTADRTLVRSLGAYRPVYVRMLGIDTERR